MGTFLRLSLRSSHTSDDLASSYRTALSDIDIMGNTFENRISDCLLRSWRLSALSGPGSPIRSGVEDPLNGGILLSQTQTLAQLSSFASHMHTSW